VTPPVLSCTEALELLHDEADDRLAPDRAPALRAHVASCAACAKAERQIAALRALFRSDPAVPAPAGFTSEVMARLPQGRLRVLPRIMFPLAAAAALVAGAIVLSKVGDRRERDMAGAWEQEGRAASAGKRIAGDRAFKSSESGTPEKPAAPDVGLLDRESGAAAPADESPVPAASAGATPATKPDEVAETSRKAHDAAEKDHGKEAEEPSGDEKKADPAAASAFEARGRAAAMPRVRVLVFRSDAKAQAFLRSQEVWKSKKSDSKQRGDGFAAGAAPPPGDEPSGPGGGGPQTPGTAQGFGGGGGAGGVGGGTGGARGDSGADRGGGAPARRDTVPPGDAAAQTPAAEGASARVVGQAIVVNDAWTRRAEELGAREVPMPAVPARQVAFETMARSQGLEAAVLDVLREDLRRSRESTVAKDGDPAKAPPAPAGAGGKAGGGAPKEPAPEAAKGPAAPKPATTQPPAATPAPAKPPAPAPRAAEGPQTGGAPAGGTAAPAPAPAPSTAPSTATATATKRDDGERAEPTIVVVVVEEPTPSAR
jgi:putative zinc finger protein